MLSKGASLPSGARKTLTFHLSYMEVYKDDVFDLFVERASVSQLHLHPIEKPIKFIWLGFEAINNDQRAWTDYHSASDISSIPIRGGI